MGDSVKAKSRRRYRVRRWTFLAIAALVVIVGLAIVIDTALYYDEVHGGVRVAGVPLGGLTEEEATAALTTHVAQVQTRPVALIGANRTFEVALGPACVVAAVVEIAFGHDTEGADGGEHSALGAVDFVDAIAFPHRPALTAAWQI